MNTVVIYHGGCRDGFCAAWIYNKWMQNNDRLIMGEPEYFPGYYGQEPPDVKDKNVVILDFCYPLEVMKSILNESANMLWLDHHKTAQPVCDWLMDESYKYGTMLDFRFDNNRSGAGLTWDYFFPSQWRPWIVSYVEDRDLWAKQLDRSDIVNAYIACLKFDFGVWDNASELPVDMVAELGRAAQMKTEQYVNEVCKNVYFGILKDPNAINGTDEYNIPIVNICQVDCSEVLHALCERNPMAPFSLYWFKRQDGLYQYGLRSIGDFDVSSVAKLFGGGGHKNAAGFQLPYLIEELK